MRSIRTTPIIILVLIVASLLLGWFVWPSHYKHSVINVGIFGKQKIRTDVITGQHQIYGEGRWQKVEISPNGEVTILKGTQLTVGGQ